MKIPPLPLFGLLIIVTSASYAIGAPPLPILEETFDGNLNEGFARRVLQHRHVSLVESGGPDGSNAIRVAYVGYDLGSERVVFEYPLYAILDEATLSFDVMFEHGFQWTLGGKLHGLGPTRPRTGGAAQRADRWAARIMFNQHGRVSTYLSDQDTPPAAGNSSPINFLQPGRWYRVVLQVSLNDVGKRNGYARLWINGEEVAFTRNRAFRATAHNDGRIRNLMFNTFHGGGSPSYAPVDEEGNYTTVYAKFDNFRVYEGIVLPDFPAFARPYEIPAVARFKDYPDVIYIDPGGNQGTGTIEAPLNTFHGLTLEPGTAYLIRRGSVLSEPLDNTWIDVLVGAYGQGEMPVLDQGLHIRGGSRNAVFRDLKIRRTGDGTTNSLNSVVKFGQSPKPRAITIAYCRITGHDAGSGYPWSAISNGADDLIFFHNEVSFSESTGWHVGGQNIRIIRNWFHAINTDGDSGSTLHSSEFLQNAYIAGNYFDMRGSAGGTTVMIDPPADPARHLSGNIRLLHNTIHAPQQGLDGTAVRWKPGSNSQFQRNLVNSLPNLAVPLHTTAEAAQDPEPFGIRENHILYHSPGSAEASGIALDSSNLVFTSLQEYDSFLANHPHVFPPGSDITPEFFWSHPVIDDRSGLMPSRPQQPSATTVGHRMVLLHWKHADRASFYDVYRAQGGGAFLRIGTVSEPSFVDNQGLRSGLTYGYQILAVNDTGSSLPSAPVIRTIPFRLSEWAGLPVDPNHWVMGHPALGDLYLEFNPWIYSAAFANWIFIPPEEVFPDHLWIYIPNPVRP